MQKVKFVTEFGGFGGSTIALMQHCALLNASGYESHVYSDDKWLLSNFKSSRKMSDLSVDEDDIMVYHLTELGRRPKCKKAYLYIHEKTVWNLRSKKFSGFDDIIFLNQSHMDWHGVKGFVLPNPMGGLVESSLHSPPGENIAGVVGTIQPRKLQHRSVKKALADGRSKVLLFGDYNKEYFEGYIKPLLSDKVEYMGLCDPARRMEMYSSFDVLYIDSSDESASLVLGECRMLQKEVVKDERVEEYEIVSDDEVVGLWARLFSEESRWIDNDRAIVDPEGKCENLVCVVTYNRKELISKWLKAWNNAEKFGAKIAVFHAFDGESPPQEETYNILAGKPDYYVPFHNTKLRDMQAFILAISDRAMLPEWNFMFWFTDDCIPMRKDFLRPFYEKINMPNVGLVAKCFEPRPNNYDGDAILPHIRTIAYALRREAANHLSFPTVGPESDRPYLFEHGRKDFYEDHILNQVMNAGFKFMTAHCDADLTREKDPPSNYVHWIDTMTWMWDCHLFENGTNFGGHVITAEDYWRIYERQFVPEDDKDDLTIFSSKFCEKSTLVPKKICAIVPTFSSPMNCFMWSVFSLLLRSRPSELEHIIIGINGPDSRDPNPNGCPLQDRKQRFVEELRGIRVWDRGDMLNPGAVTLIRTWSRIGHSQMLEQCINWVHTEYYLCMHDDVVVMDRNWSQGVSEFESDPKLVMLTWGSPLMCKMQNNHGTLDMPHMNTIFTICNKPLMKMMDASWIGYHLDKKFRISDLEDFNKVTELQDRLGSLEKEHPSLTIRGDMQFEHCSLDIGSFVYPKIKKFGLRIGSLPESCIGHFGGVSWRNSDVAYAHHPEVADLEKEIMSIPQYADIYERYKEDVT